MYKLVVSVVMSTASAFGAAYTASVSGNWNNAATWGGAGIPGSGDTAMINNGITVTIPSGYQAIIGTSDGGTATALGCSNGDTGTGALVLASGSTLTFRGTIVQCRHSTWTINAGAVVEHDSSLATGTPSYYWRCGATATDLTSPVLNINGSAESHVIFRKAAGSGDAGGFTPNASGSRTSSCKINGTYIDISDWNDSVTKNWYKGDFDSDGGLTLDYFTAITNVGGFEIDNLVSSFPFNISHSVLGRNTITGRSIYIFNSIAATGSPTRTISNSVIPGTLQAIGTGSNSGMTVRDSVIASFATASAPLMTMQHLLYDPRVTGTGIQTGLTQGMTTKSYFHSSNLESTVNAHVASWRVNPGASTVSDSIFDTAGGTGGGSDYIQVELNPSTANSVTITRNILLLSAQGGINGNLFNNATTSNVVTTNLTVTFNHNTLPLAGTTQVSGAGGETSGTGTSTPGEFASTQSNIAYSPSPYVACFNSWLGGAGPADGTFANSDYNWFWNITGNPYTQTGCPAPSKYNPNPPGAHDGRGGNPLFADATRRLVLFDQDYLRIPLSGTSWSLGVAYTAGQVVKHAVSGAYDGREINWRCITNHTSAAINEPGQYSATACGATCTWPSLWEPEAISQIKSSLLAGQTFTDGAIGVAGTSAVGALVNWVTRGFTPQNRVMCAAGHDGTAPGAVACDPPTAIVPATY